MPHPAARPLPPPAKKMRSAVRTVQEIKGRQSLHSDGSGCHDEGSVMALLCSAVRARLDLVYAIDRTGMLVQHVGVEADERALAVVCVIPHVVHFRITA